ncbi:MarR family winged helix-turn-helix transcriptional regulator [Alicyclobacillus contaminans]|uniref:MarR family winged helix-turn-helix transcriptional regulator n=1 Tax=Alicyclobacillus contaminans TaxID=392016 RepID=UPI00047E9279|nr:MarR family transcriptional regulator [Alicyclobacillus contaminans]
MSDQDALERVTQSLQAIQRYLRRNRMNEEDGITRVQWLILWDLWRNEQRTIGELAAVLDVRSSTMSQMLDRLQLAGLVVRAPAAEDGRARVVRLTEAGRARIQRLKDAKTAWLAGPFQQLTVDEQQQLAELLGKLANALPTRGD